MTKAVKNPEIKEVGPKPIKPSSVTVQEPGFVYKTVVVEMPDDVTLDDAFNNPSIWRNVQADRTGKSLVEDDKIEARWFGMWVYAVVDHADHAGASFIDIRKVTKKDRDRIPYTDGVYEIRLLMVVGRTTARLMMFAWTPRPGRPLRQLKQNWRGNTQAGSRNGEGTNRAARLELRGPRWHRRFSQGLSRTKPRASTCGPCRNHQAWSPRNLARGLERRRAYTSGHGGRRNLRHNNLPS